MQCRGLDSLETEGGGKSLQVQMSSYVSYAGAESDHACTAHDPQLLRRVLGFGTLGRSCEHNLPPAEKVINYARLKSMIENPGEPMLSSAAQSKTDMKIF